MFYKWCKGNNVSVIRNELGFEYTWDKERLYYPDFYLPELDCYVEIKGYQTDRDDCKWSDFKRELLIVKSEQIKLIEQNNFSVDELLSCLFAV